MLQSGQVKYIFKTYRPTLHPIMSGTKCDIDKPITSVESGHQYD